MALLALDTATRMISIALHDGARILAEHTWHSHNNHSTQVAPAVADLLEDSGMSAAGLSAVAVAIGPGAYTGLRAGVALAKGMASALGIPLVGIPTFDILVAVQPTQTNLTLIAVLGAGRDRVTVARFQARKRQWVQRADADNLTWAALLADLDGATLLTGEIDDAGHDAIAQAQAAGVDVTIAPPSQRLRRAGWLAEEAWTRLRAADTDRSAFDPAGIAPIYVQTKDIPA